MSKSIKMFVLAGAAALLVASVGSVAFAANQNNVGTSSSGGTNPKGTSQSHAADNTNNAGSLVGNDGNH